MSLSWLDGIIPILQFLVNGVAKGTPAKVNLTGLGVTSSVTDDTLTVNFEGSGSGGGNTTAEYVLTTADGTLPNSRVLTGSTSVSVTNSAGTTTLACIMGTTSGTCCAGNDSRLGDSRTPTAHAASHRNGGSDEIATATAAANAIPKAGAGGTLAVNWLPTGTSSATVCIGNDVRVPASNPSSATAGQCVMSNGSRVVYRGDVGRWWRLSTAHTTTALSTDTIEAFNAAISMGQPVRILDMTGIYTQTVADLGGDASPVVKSGASITGVTGLVLDGKGSLHFKLVLVSGSTYRFDIYNDVECLTASLVGHTAGFVCTSTGDQTVAITADNASGLGGNLVMTTNGSAKLGIRRIQYLRTGIVTWYNKEDGQLNFEGQLVTTNAGAITEIWLGAPELVVCLHGQIVGAYAPETTSTALLSRNADSLVWPFAAATITHIHAKHLVADTGATQPKLIPVINGNALVLDENASTMTTNFESLTTNAKPQACVIGFGDSIELRSVAGTNLNARNAIFDIIGVLD